MKKNLVKPEELEGSKESSDIIKTIIWGGIICLLVVGLLFWLIVLILS